MATSCFSPADDLLALPSVGRMNDPCAQGRLAAFRTFADAMSSPDGRAAYQLALRAVDTGRAPQSFKDAYFATMRHLHAAFDTSTGN